MKKTNHQNYMKIEVQSKEFNLEVVPLAVANFARQLSFTQEELREIEVAIYEAVQNCILHAYKDDQGRITVIATIVKGNTLDIIVKDRGVGIVDVKEAMRPFSSTVNEVVGRSGLGFTIIEAFMTKCKVRSVVGKGTTVHMKRRVTK